MNSRSNALDAQLKGRRSWDVSALLRLVDGVLVGLCGVYGTTRSVWVTAIAAGAVLILACPVVWRR